MNRKDRILQQIRQNPKLVVSDDFELVVIEREVLRQSYVNGTTKETLKEKQSWMNLRLIQRKTPGLASVSGESNEAIKHLVEAAIKACEASKVDPWFRFPIWRPQATHSRTELPEFSPEEKENAVRMSFPALSKKPYLFFESHQMITEHVNIFRKHEKQVLSRSRRRFCTKFNLSLKSGSEAFQAEIKAPTFNTDSRRDVLEELLGSALQMEGAPAYDGPAPERFILGPRVIADLLREEKEFFFAGQDAGDERLNLPVSEALTLVDDGTDTGLMESGAFDMEGSLCERTVLAEGGGLRSLLHNTQSATRENRLSTGNFVLDINDKLPAIGFTNFFIERGKNPDLAERLDEGLVLDRVERVARTPSTGKVFSLSGFSFRRGRLIEPVCRVPLILPIKDLLCFAVDVGQDLEFFGNIGSPSILFEKKP